MLEDIKLEIVQDNPTVFEEEYGLYNMLEDIKLEIVQDNPTVFEEEYAKLQDK